MRCEHLTEQFYAANIDLATFLSVSDEELQGIGVKLPFQRRRILAGLHRFHKHPFKQQSIPSVPKNETYRYLLTLFLCWLKVVFYSTIDVSVALIAAIRQIMAMEGSLRYLQNSVIKEEEKSKFAEQIKNVRERVVILRKLARALNKLAQEVSIFDIR